MIPVILCGSFSDTFFHRLAGALERAGGVACAGSDIGILSAKHPRFLLTISDEKGKLFGGTGILVLNGQTKTGKLPLIPEGFLTVVSSSDDGALHCLKQAGQPAITCGMAVRDTFSISSLKEDGASVSLQRDLVRLDGKLLEEREIPVHLTAPSRPDDLLYMAAVLVLAGISEDELTI